MTESEAVKKYCSPLTCFACEVKFTLENAAECCDMAHVERWGHEWVSPRVLQLTESLFQANRFKAFVHSYLDAHGVPHGDPDNVHQKEGCRIGARLDLLFAQRDAMKLVGAQMSNLCCNLSQEAHAEAPSLRTREIMRRLYREWDEATKEKL